MAFIDIFRSRHDISFIGMRKAAMEELSSYSKLELDQLYEDLDRGRGVLDDEDHLNMYLRSFGLMHKEKLQTAFNCIPNFVDFSNQDIEIYDWGCGQGTATICLLDYISKECHNHRVKRITLIDPSEAATSRAQSVIGCYSIVNQCDIRIVTKGFDDLVRDDIEPTYTSKLHLFSNILDVAYFDLANFINLFQSTFNTGNNHFICVGPFYSNNRRVDDFLAAIDPDSIIASIDLQRGQWVKEWTISMRLFSKAFTEVEDVQVIRRRIVEAQMHQQYHAGYILDEVSSSLNELQERLHDTAEALLQSLCAFDVRSNKSLSLPDDIDSKWAVINNMIVRGTPTIAPLKLQELFADSFGKSTKPNGDTPTIWFSKQGTNVQAIFEALHIIDPRFTIENYNGDMLESDFEKHFVESILNGSASKYLIQLLEPQRPLSSIVSVPDQKFSQDQRVDFALELPYSLGNDETTPAGFIIEIDGTPYHSNIFQRRKDARRDAFAHRTNWDTYRLTENPDNSFVNNWEAETSLVQYLQIAKANYDKPLTGDWLETLQMVLSPIAVARLEKTIVEAVLTGALDLNAEEWSILVIERDVPCAVMAIRHIQELYQHICLISGDEQKLPKVNLDVVSTPDFSSSPLHCGHSVLTATTSKHYDICFDISMLLRDKIDALPNTAEADTYYIIRTSHYKKRARNIYSAKSIEYLPLVTRNNQGEYLELEQPKENLTYFLQNIFRKRAFRKGQLPILNRSLSNRTTIGLLPTGGGKSLIYQLSAMLEPGVSLIVDPLISLMIDQYRGLQEIRINASACVNSTMNFAEKTRNLNRMQNGELLFIFLSPERFMMENFRENLQSMSRRNGVYFSYGVIDEVHCVSEWGHNFKPSYLHLGRNMINFMHTKSGSDVPIIGLTATASFDVLADVERELTLGGNLTLDIDAVVRPENDTRPELTYKIIGVDADMSPLRSTDEQMVLNVQSEWDLKRVVADSKKQRIQKLLDEIPNDLDKINEKSDITTIPNFAPHRFYNEDENQEYPYAGILFCPHAKGLFGVKDTERSPGISSYLLANDSNRLRLGTFVGGDKPSGDMTTFNQNHQNIMVATKAFGMGIDKPNVRYTINLNHPSSIESFVQEAGRGGRDRKNAISYLLFENTEYIFLTIDKINDLTTLVLNSREYPQWLWNYRDKYILKEDFIPLMLQNGATESEANQVVDYCIERSLFESVDKDIELWFHNNSFRGLFKEKVILLEMTDRILNVRPTNLLTIQNELREQLGNEDILLQLRIQRNAMVVASAEDRTQQYGNLFLDNLHPTYKFVNFDLGVCRRVMGTLIDILKQSEDHSATWLNQPVAGIEVEDEGIYSALDRMPDNEYVYVTVTWENQIQQDYEEFEQSVRNAITSIARRQQWNMMDEQRHGTLNLRKIDCFEDLLQKISRLSDDIRWVQYHASTNIYTELNRAFCRKRDKDDTDKAIYRMCCVGLVEDVMIDYNLETYLLKVRRRTDEEYLSCMLDFFKKYYSLEQAETKVAEIKEHAGRNTLDKCLGYLADFVYQSLERKRYRSIDDMRLACEDGLSNGEEWLKEFIHLYFNSKYARDDYRVGENDYSLKQDTDRRSETFDIVRKYIEVISLDNSGSEIENVKHLYGATLLVLRAHPENAALNLLRTFCIIFLGAGNNETLKHDALTSYVNGFVRLHSEQYETISSLISIIEEYNAILQRYVHEDEPFMQEKIINEGKELIMLNIHNNWINNFKTKYCKK